MHTATYMISNWIFILKIKVVDMHKLYDVTSTNEK